MLAYNCSPSFNWRKKLPMHDDRRVPERIGAMGYKFQFVTLAGFHALNHVDVRAGARLQGPRHGARTRSCRSAEFAAEKDGFTAVRHQREVGTGYFDAVAMALSAGKSSTTAMAGSTETEQFHDGHHGAAEAAE